MLCCVVLFIHSAASDHAVGTVGICRTSEAEAQKEIKEREKYKIKRVVQMPAGPDCGVVRFNRGSTFHNRCRLDVPCG